MATGIDIKVLGGNHMFCEACALGKSHRQPSTHPMTRSTTPGYRFHLDLTGGGKTLTTYGGSSYFLIIVDDATRYWWFIPMAKKSQTQVEIKRFIPMVQNQYSFTIALAVTLYEALEKKKPDLGILRVFGCNAYVFDEKSKGRWKDGCQSMERIWDPINSKNSLLTEAVGASDGFGIDITELILTEISPKKGVNSVSHTISGNKQVAVTANTIEEDTQQLLSYQQQLQQPQETYELRSDDELDETDQEDNEASVGQDKYGSYTVDIDGSKIYDSIRVGPSAPQFSTTPPPSPTKCSSLQDLPRRTYSKQVVEGFTRAAKAELRNDTPITYKDANRSSRSEEWNKAMKAELHSHEENYT
ncbi:MAG: copia-like retrotransposon family [Lasallia pustulata]|uniref:Copia-like retrotransposon family n=1 Tax=Lasallia pustulata TaxID=136370 RepID=A0A5M8PR12_9LECA|nr:MAG: copia-like retrotransposon family [Lasallia pustulata]